MTHCIEIQERIALGQPLRDEERLHVSSCQQCSRVAETYSLLDASFSSLAEAVPLGFADRVMSRLLAQEVTRAPRWFDAGWIELALTNAALICALLNTVRFLAGVLIPSVSLGAAP